MASFVDVKLLNTDQIRHINVDHIKSLRDHGLGTGSKAATVVQFADREEMAVEGDIRNLLDKIRTVHGRG